MDAILLHGIKTHNLKNLDLVLPHKKIYVVTGVSGSGKSSLAFDTLYAEGQRRYVESLSAYARQFLERMERPDVESVSGIPPALAIQAKNVISNARSTVGTQTEINDYLRVLFARVGRTLCPDCSVPVVRNQPETVADFLLKNHPEKETAILFTISLGKKSGRNLKDFFPELERQGFTEFFMEGKIQTGDQVLTSRFKKEQISICCDRIKAISKNRKRMIDSLEMAYRWGRGDIQVVLLDEGKNFQFSEGLRCFSCGRKFREPSPNLFSFNSPLGACEICQGFGRVITIDWNLVVPDEKKSIAEGAVEPWTKPSAAWEFKQLLKFCAKRKIPVNRPWKQLPEASRRLILHGEKIKDFASVKDFFDYLETKTYKMHIRIFLSKYRAFIPCPACRETRLKPEALWVRVAKKSIAELQDLDIESLLGFMEGLHLSADELERAEPAYLEIKKRVRFLKEVGLGYLSLSRLSRTLSGGEVQRIHLATSLGSALVDTLYVLDEPSVGLHERDNDLLIRLLRELRDLGNTVVVVEHDRTMIEAADEVIDLGPGGGEKGGELIFQGTVEDLKKCPASITGQYLAGLRQVTRGSRPKPEKKESIRIRGAAEHNLKNLDVQIPLHQLVAITGVSGSGKSTLLYEILYHHFLRFRGQPVQDLGKVRSIEGFEAVDDMILIDQSPIGRSPRSNPATYLKAFDEVRKIFARTPDARRAGFQAGHFSFNVDGGRCDACKGDGRIKVEMHFLADVFIPCETCQAKRFKPEVLEIRHRGKNVDDVLALTVSEALNFFQEETALIAKLSVLEKLGLGYIRLGQSATTLSGGEAQRLKLASEMTLSSSRHTVYLFDEPTVGLHDSDIAYLMQAFDELLARGHSIIVIEHHMEIIRSADTVIDLGPEGGEKGGRLLFSGSVADLVECTDSYTGRYLHLKFFKKAGNL